MVEATVSAGNASSLIELAVSKGALREELHRRSGVAPERLRDQDNRVLKSEYFHLVRAAEELTANPAFALEYGTTVHMQEFSILGLIFHACETVRDAIVQANRYGLGHRRGRGNCRSVSVASPSRAAVAGRSAT